MEILGYTYITHKLIERPWGPELRFTIEDSQGQHINEAIPIGSMSATEAEIVEAILACLDRRRLAKELEESLDGYENSNNLG